MPKTAPHKELAENPVQELFLYSSCLSSSLDKAEILMTFCLKHILAMPHSNGLWFSSFSRGLQCLGSTGAISLQQHFTSFTEHSEHAFLQQHLDSEHCSEVDGETNGKILLEMEKKIPLFQTSFHIYTLPYTEWESICFALSPNFFSPQIASSPHFPQSRAICPSSRTSQT